MKCGCSFRHRDGSLRSTVSPERLSNLEDYANEGCSVRGTKDEIMAEIFTEWAPAQEDLEDDFEL